MFFPNIGTIGLDQVEDGRDGGNPEFDGEVTDQYTAEVTFTSSIVTFYRNLLEKKSILYCSKYTAEVTLNKTILDGCS